MSERRSTHQEDNEREKEHSPRRQRAREGALTKKTIGALTKKTTSERRSTHQEDNEREKEHSPRRQRAREGALTKKTMSERRSTHQEDNEREKEHNERGGSPVGRSQHVILSEYVFCFAPHPLCYKQQEYQRNNNKISPFVF